MQKPPVRRLVSSREGVVRPPVGATQMGRVANKEVRTFDHTRPNPAEKKTYEAIQGPDIPEKKTPEKPVSSRPVLNTQRPARGNPVVARPARPVAEKTGRKPSMFSQSEGHKTDTKIFVSFQVHPDVEVETASPLLHPLMDIEIVVFEDDEEVKRLPFDDRDEAKAMKALLEIINSSETPQVITYLGRVYLLPRLHVVAMRDKLKRGLVASTGNRYSSFQTRFSSTYHMDIADIISNYGATNPPPLNDIYEVVACKDAPKRGVDSLIFLYHALKETE